MLLHDKVVALRTFGIELKKCGSLWGKNVDLSDLGPIKAYIGKESWIETSVKGVIGIHGNEPGKGPGIMLQDIEHSDIDMIWTGGLIGCIALAISGRSKDGTLDAFFCHARKYDEKEAIKNSDNPMKLAHDFVKSHDDIRVLWGTDFNFGTKGFSGQHKRNEAQKLLSRELGCWVRTNDCIVARELVYFPKLGIMKDGSPIKAYKWAASQDLVSRSEFSRSMSLAKFVPDSITLDKLEQQLTGLKKDRASLFRSYLYDSKRSNKISILEQVLTAYKVGNFDILRHFAHSAEKKSSPFIDPKAAHAWGTREKSTTATLVMEAFSDAKDKILEMGEHGCGLRDSGQDISSHDEYRQIRQAISIKTK